MYIVMSNLIKGEDTIFRKKEFFDNPDSYDVYLETEEGNLNISETTNAVPEQEKEFLAFIKKSIQTANTISIADNGEENLRHWIAASNDQGFLYDFDFPKNHTHYEVSSLEDWAKDEIVNLGYITDDGLRLLTGHTNFKDVAEELLENSEYEYTELDSGNILIYTY